MNSIITVYAEGCGFNQSPCGLPNVSKHSTDKSCFSTCRFFLMYLINKDETEHTGQVG